MNKNELETLVVNKVEEIKQLIEDDFSRGRISFDARNRSLFYVDQLRYSVQKLMGMISSND